MFEASPSPTPTQYTTTTDSTSFPRTISERNSIDEGSFPVIRGEREGSHETGGLEQRLEGLETVFPSDNGMVEGPLKAEGGLGITRQNHLTTSPIYTSGMDDLNMETYTDDTPLASDSHNEGVHGMPFFGREDTSNNRAHTQSQLYNQPQSQQKNFFSNNATIGDFQHIQPQRTPINIDVKPNVGNLQYGIGIGEAGPSTFAHHRPRSRGTTGSPSVSPVIARHGNFSKLGPLSSTNHVAASMPPPSPIGIRVGLTDGESDQAKSAPGSMKKPRRSAKPRASIASTSSVGDIGVNFAGMGLMSNGGGMVPPGMDMRLSYGMPFSAQTSTLPTPTGSNEDDESSRTKHWKVVHPPHMSLNK
jgi:hypothetical protein